MTDSLEEHGPEEEHGPGGMDAIDDAPLVDSDEPGGMSGIPDADAPEHEKHPQRD
jgi:hypothetical protein